MVIKLMAIGSLHGCNVVNYDLEKNRDNPKDIAPVFLASNNLPVDEISGIPLSPDDVWTTMQIRQKNSGHKIKNPFWRIEICPTKEECDGWSLDDWKQCLDDAIRHLDKEPQKNKKGKVIGKGTDIANSQWVAALHLDSNHYHIHLFANRITMNNSCQSTNDNWGRAKRAADAMAVERGWTKAEDMTSQRRSQIYNDAKEILRGMSKFDIDDYFAQMRGKGWIIDATRDNKGNWVNYRIGEHLIKPNGEKSSDIKIASSNVNRNITIANLPRTWAMYHKYDKEIKKPVIMAEKPIIDPIICPANDPKMEESETYIKTPVWKCAEHTMAENWDDEGETMRIPDVVYNAIDKEIPTINKMDYRNPNDEIPERADVIAVAIFEFLMAADARVPSGGGGGTSSDLRWDGLTEDDLKRMAKGAAHSAYSKCTSKLSKRGGISY